MDGHVWRVPTLLGVMACSALLLFAAAVVASAITCRRRSMSIRLVIGLIIVLIAVAAVIALRATATSIARSLDISMTQVEPGVVGYVAPLMFASFAFAVGKRMLKGAWVGRRALLFYAWLFGFTAANVVNRCSPGWCTTIGFPFPWHAWSDAIVTFGDDRFVDVIEASGKVIGAVLNLITFVLVAGVLTGLRVRRRSA